MHFVPEDAAHSAFRGYVRVDDDEFAVRVSNVMYDDSTGRTMLNLAQLDVESALATQLEPHSATLKLRLVQASSLVGFATELEELVAICCRKKTNTQAKVPSAKYYERLLEELDIVGWNRLGELSDDLRSLELNIKDQAGRNHTIRVILPLQFETVGCAEKLECLVDAPEPFELEWPPKNKKAVLHEVIKQFERFLAKFQRFWDVLDALDGATCVLEPHHPTRATGRRRVALERHASVQFQVDPVAPTALLTELSFYGNQSKIGLWRERWDNNAFTKWDPAQLLHKNLENVLEFTLPSPKTTNLDEFAIECGICYSYQLQEDNDVDEQKNQSIESVMTQVEPGSRIPDRQCENLKCNRPFHAKCLFDWLRALPTSRLSFYTVFGECPYCREAISTKFQPDF
ncbi:hypothetical protein CCR75_004444 [Bremia lactucae]|uniref:E3 ubiquitin-protein ligase FANCL n=1 Tax=Bremia lactucae TaxID=4779 RepID=A0A976NXP1_BRELC|nr:hypothetical protein CCR75_004444 [Bremia lactucae]